MQRICDGGSQFLALAVAPVQLQAYLQMIRNRVTFSAERGIVCIAVRPCSLHP